MARRRWGKFVREVLEVSEKYDTQLQVSMGVENGALPEETYRAWQAIQPSFIPNTVCEWLSDHALKACEAWARGYGEKGGIIWIDHIEFGRELARRTGWKMYTEGGLSSDGEYIGNAKATDIVIASRMACATGHNLQRWSRNLVTAPPNGGVDWEQMIGRTHRTGQTAGVVEFWYFNAGLEFARSVENALAESKYVQHTTGAQQRLNLADVVPPIQGSGPAWGLD